MEEKVQNTREAVGVMSDNKEGRQEPNVATWTSCANYKKKMYSLRLQN